MYHFGLKVGDTDDELRAALAEVKSHDVKVVGASDHGVTHSLYIEDPDGNEIELYIDVQPESWRENPKVFMAPTRALRL
jgi:catechol-2,3-dioxygenase